jgi:hypothetical protein
MSTTPARRRRAAIASLAVSGVVAHPVAPAQATTPITAELLGASNGKADDVLTVNASSASAGAGVKLFRLKAGGRKLVAEDVLNAKGNRTFVVDDRNGKRFTKYVAVVDETETTPSDQTNQKRVR